MSDMVVVQEKEFDIITIDDRDVISVTEEVISVLSIGIQGPEGIQGEKGDKGDVADTIISAQAGEPIQIHRVLYITAITKPPFFNPVPKVFVLKNDDEFIDHVLRFVGVSLQSVNSDEQVEILTAGILQDPSFDFTPGAGVFVNHEGILSQMIFNEVFRFQIGIALEPDKILINPKLPIILS